MRRTNRPFVPLSITISGGCYPTKFLDRSLNALALFFTLAANPLVQGGDHTGHPMHRDRDEKMVLGKVSQPSRPKIPKRQSYLTCDHWLYDPGPARRAR